MYLEGKSLPEHEKAGHLLAEASSGGPAGPL